MKKIIITGANGQLGQEIKAIANTISDAEFFYTDIDTLDLSDEIRLNNYLSEIEPDILVNCAAFTAVDKAEEDIEGATKGNALVPKMLAQFANKLGYKLIHVSTDYVFSGDSFQPINESYPTEPKTVYGKTKLEGEVLVANLTDAVIIRTSWLYSVFGNNFVKSMIRLGKERDELGVVFDQIGSPTNAADLASAILQIISTFQQNNTWHPGVYHFSNEGVCSWYDFALQIMEFAEITCLVKPIRTEEYPLPAPRPFYSVLDKHKIKTQFDLTIPHWKTSLIPVVKEITK